MTLKLPQTVISDQDLRSLILEVRVYARWFSHNATKKRVGVTTPSDPPVISPAAVEVITGWSTKKNASRETLDDLIEELQNVLVTAPRASITLAAPATNELRRTLTGWCRENLAPDILVNFSFNSTLLGGMVVRYGSRIFDWSFRRSILAERQKFPEVLRNV